MERFILPVARAEKAICFAITEPEAGSDAGALQTRAVRDGDDYVLNGTKRFISGSPFCDMAVVIASTSEDPSVRETTAFFVERSRPGVPHRGRLQDHGRPVAAPATSCWSDCRVPAANQIGERGRGLALALGRITVNRLLHCPAMLGLARLALRRFAAHYARGAAPVRPADRRLPGGAAHAGRHGDRTCRRARADAERGARRSTPAAKPRRGLDGQAVLLRDGLPHRRPRGADPRRRGHRAGQPRGVPVPHAAHVPGADRNQRDPAQHHRQGTARRCRRAASQPSTEETDMFQIPAARPRARLRAARRRRRGACPGTGRPGRSG